MLLPSLGCRTPFGAIGSIHWQARTDTAPKLNKFIILPVRILRVLLDVLAEVLASVVALQSPRLNADFFFVPLTSLSRGAMAQHSSFFFLSSSVTTSCTRTDEVLSVNGTDDVPSANHCSPNPKEISAGTNTESGDFVGCCLVCRARRLLSPNHLDILYSSRRRDKIRRLVHASEQQVCDDSSRRCTHPRWTAAKVSTGRW